MILKFTDEDRKAWAEIKSGWLIVLIWFALGSSHFLVEAFFGQGWGLVTTIVALLVWFILRPWQIGLLPLRSRNTIFALGTLTLCGWIIDTAIEYWKHQAHT